MLRFAALADRNLAEDGDAHGGGARRVGGDGFDARRGLDRHLEGE